MWLVAAASGSVFHAGPSQAMHWISLEGEGAVVSAGDRDVSHSMTGHLHVGPTVATHQTTII